jgi:hypothetical protein
MKFKSRLEKIEEKLCGKERGVKIFIVRHGHKDEDFARQYAEHIAAGGNPNDLFVNIVKFGQELLTS